MLASNGKFKNPHLSSATSPFTSKNHGRNFGFFRGQFHKGKPFIYLAIHSPSGEV
jgi:hypothetical protein